MVGRATWASFLALAGCGGLAAEGRFDVPIPAGSATTPPLAPVAVAASDPAPAWPRATSWAVKLRTTASQRAQPASVVAVLEPMDAHAELASLWAPSPRLLLLEDLGAGPGIVTTWHALRAEEPFVSIDVRWPQIVGAEHAAVNA